MTTFSMPLIVEVAIAIIVSWALFAVFCSMVHECIVQIKSERGRFTKKMIQKQLMDYPNNINWGSLLYMNSRIDLLSRAYNKPPSVIENSTFAQALIETVASSHAVQSIKTKNPSLAASYNNQTLNDFKLATTHLIPSDVISLFKQLLQKAELTATQGENRENEIYKNLCAEIEQWSKEFDNRLSIWYEKKTRARLYFLGLLISIALNIDSIQLFGYFNTNPEARVAVINYYEQNKESLIKQDSATAFAQTKDFIHKMDSLQTAAELPIGWQKHSGIDYSGNWLDTIGSILLKLLGFAISAFAAGVGAPFWFEILKKVYTPKTTK